MGKLLSTVMAILVVCAVGCTREPPPYESRYTEPADTKPVALAVLGDSFTAGTEYGGLSDHNWTSLAATKLRDQGVDVAIAKGAQKGAGWVEPNSAGVTFADEIKGSVSTTQKLVVLFGSLNDGSVPPEQVAATVTDTLGQVRQVAPAAQILVIGPPTLARGTPDKPGKIPAVRDAVRDSAVAAGAVFVDPLAENWFSDPAFIAEDGIHPTDAGHQMMADRIAPLIAEQLRTD